ncbi:hypothetical protein D3C87_711760 [compost metagenome]
MKRTSALIVLGLGSALLLAGATQAQQPVVNIGERHGNLRNAQEHIVQAYQLIGVAQQDNNARLGGHAERARQALVQADQELRQAANAANNNGRP